ncbi:HNH endonuclease signature motif containing protein [Aeromicrobium sp. Leaf350]|uniref:HNH endonuclease signature motif containing protein n=1 Tax=Aeromicrobium sp. Leaf350 TaxID=2876565 RepID=UPI001E5FB577|nr:HNH endonuclease signature motif containing protein [Aeromicrobium sp. Leaf350]
MFEDLAPEDVLAAVASADYGVVEPIDVMGGKHIDAISALERLVRVAQARIAEHVADLYALRRLDYSGDPALTVAAEAAMARGQSPSAGRSLLEVAMTLRPMPNLRQAFGDGAVSEPVVRAVVRVVRDLDPDTITAIDTHLAGRLDGLTAPQAGDLVRELVVTHDVEAAAQREQAARADQFVSYWPSPDGVGTLIVRGPAEQLVGIKQALQAHADRLRARGDDRRRGQIMVNTLFERVTGVETVAGPDVDLSIVLPVEALAGAAAAEDHVGTTGRQRQGEPKARQAPGRSPAPARHEPVRRRRRSRAPHQCRQPGCGCGIRDIDHIRPHRNGGPTTQTNGQGLCRLSNLVKELPGWHVEPGDSGEVTWTTPTGHRYTSPPPRAHPRT